MYVHTYLFMFPPFLKEWFKRVESCKNKPIFLKFFEVCKVKGNDEGY